LLDNQAQLALVEARRLPEHAPKLWKLTPEQITRLQLGQVVSQPRDPLYPLLAPLFSPQPVQPEHTALTRTPARLDLLGVLALGPLRSGLGYSREDQALLLSLADQAGTAIYVARLIRDSRAETERRVEAESRLESYRSSPLGRAEALAERLTAQPQLALVEIHSLAQSAGKDPDCASLVGNLAQALQDRDSGMLSALAEGFNYLYQSQFTPALVPIGLQNIIVSLQAMTSTLELDPAARHEHTRAAQVYRACLQAYEASSIHQIMDFEGLLHPADAAPAGLPPGYLDGLVSVLADLHPVAEALHASERVDTPADKLAYLASAVNGLRHVDHQARATLGSADQPVMEQIANSWLATVTNAMSELQTGARLVCRLLTRSTWQDDVIALALSVQNSGRGAALQVRVNLAPSSEYTLIDALAVVERLAPGEEAELHLRIRPHLSAGMDHFRARFMILYTDPRGPDQVENFADVVHLMSTGAEFQFIPNPYVVGTPLKTGSPLFMGRQDVVTFVQDNLNALHRNNLVLIGQRRTGKTSLLKQLPQRLGDEVLPVYLDGQTLGLDPGMPHFFLSLATEIAFALEDRGFAINPPELEDYQGGPAAAFEKGFLVRVRQAIGPRHLLIMFDEFEELETAVRRGDLEPSIFGFLRHLVQHHENLSVIFCGTHRLEQLASDYWNVLFNISLYQHIGYLEREQALRLVQEPVAGFGMRYDDLALEKIWRVTSGHPYFLQLLCHSLVNLHNKSQRAYLTIADVNSALDEILAAGEAHFVYMWAESTPQEQLVLTALSRMAPLTGQASPIQVVDFFDERGVTIDRAAVGGALHRLTLRDILQASFAGEAGAGSEPGSGEAYRWKLGLLGLWIEKYKSLSRVISEVVQ
ncbi:MAG: AAA family ATPase, partial [Chloroflexota bacterium]